MNKESKLLILPCSSKKSQGGVYKESLINHFSQNQALCENRGKRNKYYMALLDDPNYLKINSPGNKKKKIDRFKTSARNHLYKRAIDRYNGEFYKDGLRELLLAKIQNYNLHVLIVSGLYGLLRYDDDIMDYHLKIDQGGINKFWGKGSKNVIKNAIVDYISQNKISSIFLSS